jgi:hypothetical protein
MQSLVAAAGQRCTQLQAGQVPVRAKHRRRGLGQQRMVAARSKTAVRRSQFRVHDAALLGVLGGIGIPRNQRLMDQFI